jgi:hypothetical protein
MGVISSPSAPPSPHWATAFVPQKQDFPSGLVLDAAHLKVIFGFEKASQKQVITWLEGEASLLGEYPGSSSDLQIFLVWYCDQQSS